jgi:hypothetical protein
MPREFSRQGRGSRQQVHGSHLCGSTGLDIPINVRNEPIPANDTVAGFTHISSAVAAVLASVIRKRNDVVLGSGHALNPE